MADFPVVENGRIGVSHDWWNGYQGYSVTPEEEQLIAKYGGQVTMPQFNGLSDVLFDNKNKKWKEYLDKLHELDFNERSLSSARAYESSAYQRTVADMKAAGLNPYWLSSAGSTVGSASDSRTSYPASKGSAQSNNRVEASIVSAIARVLGIAAFIALK